MVAPVTAPTTPEQLDAVTQAIIDHRDDVVTREVGGWERMLARHALKAAAAAAPETDVDKLRAGARLLGETLQSQCDAILDILGDDATGLRFQNGDVDWDTVWETLAEGYTPYAIRTERATALSRIERALAVLDGAQIPMGEVAARHAAAILRGDRG